MSLTKQLREAYRLEEQGAEPIDILAVLCPEYFNEEDIEEDMEITLNICPHMPDDPDVYKCDFCGYERD